MDNPFLYRKRLIPNECIHLKDDEILCLNDDILVTKWKTLKPRKDFHHGYSCYFFHEGLKISKFYHEDGSFVYWYCDIVSFEKDTQSIVISDLLADVIVMPDGEVKVLDLDELCIAKEEHLLSDDAFFLSVKRLGALIKCIEDNQFTNYTNILEAYIR